MQRVNAIVELLWYAEQLFVLCLATTQDCEHSTYPVTAAVAMKRSQRSTRGIRTTGAASGRRSRGTTPSSSRRGTPVNLFADRDFHVKKWVRIKRPPAPHIKFLVDRWVLLDDLTEAERAAYDERMQAEAKERLAEWEEEGKRQEQLFKEEEEKNKSKSVEASENTVVVEKTSEDAMVVDEPSIEAQDTSASQQLQTPASTPNKTMPEETTEPSPKQHETPALSNEAQAKTATTNDTMSGTIADESEPATPAGETEEKPLETSAPVASIDMSNNPTSNARNDEKDGIEEPASKRPRLAEE